MLTGYYEPIVDGSRFPSPEFTAPLYRRPGDLLVGGKKAPKSSFPNRASSAASTARSRSSPITTALAIEDGALDGRELEIAWIKDPWEALSIQIQGSARVRLEDGTMLRLNYDAHNGHSYTAVGRILIERDLVPSEEMSMDRIRQWMAKQSGRGARRCAARTSRSCSSASPGSTPTTEPSGAQGVPLTPGRSIAVDRTHVYGTPFFIDAELPIDGPRTKDHSAG